MTAEHFQVQMNRLANTFGGAYKTERTQIIWREMGNLPEEAFTRMVDKLIGECRQAPMIQEFREAASSEREKIWSKTKDDRMSRTMDNVRAFASCGQCHGQGVVLARRRDDSSPWAFKCVCSQGRNDPRNFPIWNPMFDGEVV